MEKDISQKKLYTISGLSLVLIIVLAGFSFFLAPPATDKITGWSTSKVYVLSTPPTNCTTYLGTGLNFVSFFCELGYYPINETLKDINNNTIEYYAIWSYNPNNPDDPWDISNPSLPNYTVQELSTIDRYHGYWIKMNSANTYFTTGYKFPDTSTPLRAGWNLIGYPSGVAKDINESLQTINTSFTELHSYNSGSWLIFNNETGGNISIMEPMKAYWINMSINDTWYVDW